MPASKGSVWSQNSVAVEDEARLDPQHVQRVQSERRQAVRLACLPHRVPHRRRVLGMAPDLIAQLTGVPGARDTMGMPSKSPMRPMLKRNQPSSPMRPARAPSTPLARESCGFRAPAPRCCDLLGGGLHPGSEALLLRLLTQPDPAVVDHRLSSESSPGPAGTRCRRRACRRCRSTWRCRRPGPPPASSCCASRSICISASASGPTTSNFRSGDRSVMIARSRQAQYSSMAPWLVNEVGNQ